MAFCPDSDLKVFRPTANLSGSPDPAIFWFWLFCVRTGSRPWGLKSGFFVRIRTTPFLLLPGVLCQWGMLMTPWLTHWQWASVKSIFTSFAYHQCLIRLTTISALQRCFTGNPKWNYWYSWRLGDCYGTWYWDIVRLMINHNKWRNMLIDTDSIVIESYRLTCIHNVPNPESPALRSCVGIKRCYL